MSPALLQLILALAAQIPSAVATVQQLIADKGADPTPEELESLANQYAIDRAAAETAIAAAGPEVAP